MKRYVNLALAFFVLDAVMFVSQNCGSSGGPKTQIAAEKPTDGFLPGGANDDGAPPAKDNPDSDELVIEIPTNYDNDNNDNSNPPIVDNDDYSDGDTNDDNSNVDGGDPLEDEPAVGGGSNDEEYIADNNNPEDSESGRDNEEITADDDQLTTNQDSDDGLFKNYACRGLDIEDIQLNVYGLELIGKNSTLGFIKTNSKVSLKDLADGLEVSALTNATVKKVRLMLAHDGNFLVSNTGEKFSLKLPAKKSGFNGIVLKLQKVAKVEEGTTYRLQANFDNEAEFLTRKHGKKPCKLKAVWKNASLN